MIGMRTDKSAFASDTLRHHGGSIGWSRRWRSTRGNFADGEGENFRTTDNKTDVYHTSSSHLIGCYFGPVISDRRLAANNPP